MITADLIKKAAWLSSIHIEQLLRKTYPKDVVVGCEFLGISNGKQFCYKISYPDTYVGHGVLHAKVYVWEDHNGQLLADY